MMNQVNQNNENKPFHKGSNIPLFSLSGYILIIFFIVLSFYIYQPILGVIVFIVLFFVLSRFHYKVYFYIDKIKVYNPMYFWKRNKEKTYIYTDIKLFKYNGISLNAAPFAIMKMKSGDIVKFDQLDVGRDMKKLIAVLENYNVPIEGIDKVKYGLIKKPKTDD